MNDLLPCPLCGDKLVSYINDITDSWFADGEPCWDAGANCEGCYVNFGAGTFWGNFTVERIEEIIVETLNQRP